MLYYLISNSSILKNHNKKAAQVGVILIGSIIYILIHAFLSFSKNQTFKKLIKYFWMLFALDISLFHFSKDKLETSNKENQSFIEELFSIKNKISNIFKNSLRNGNDSSKSKEDILQEEKDKLKQEKENLLKLLTNNNKEIVDNKINNHDSNDNDTDNDNDNDNDNDKDNDNDNDNLNNNKNNSTNLINKTNKENIQTSNSELKIENNEESFSTPINIIRKKNKNNSKTNIVSIINNSDNNSDNNLSNNSNNNLGITNQKDSFKKPLEEIKIDDFNFDDNSSESGSEMDFDIADFNSSL